MGANNISQIQRQVEELRKSINVHAEDEPDFVIAVRFFNADLEETGGFDLRIPRGGAALRGGSSS